MILCGGSFFAYNRVFSVARQRNIVVKVGNDPFRDAPHVFEQELRERRYGDVLVSCPDAGIMVCGIGDGYGDIFHGWAHRQRREILPGVE